MIQFNKAGKRYEGGREGLSQVDLHIHPGEMAFLTGHSGAGKSTLLKMIALIERATYGQVVVNGKNLSRIRRRQIPYVRRDIGIIFQNHKLLYDRSVFDNVALPLVIAGHGHGEIQRRVRASLDKVGLLDKERRFPVMLSGGEQQRVGIARAVVNKPPLLLADEPTGNLDPGNKDRVLDILFDYAREHTATLITVTHDHDLIPRFDRVIDFKSFLGPPGHPTGEPAL